MPPEATAPLSLACLLALCLTACQGGFTPAAMEKSEDDAARADHWMNAAITYYDGGRYDLAAQMFDRVLRIRPDDQRAKRGLANSMYLKPDTPPELRHAELVRAETLLLEVKDLDWTHANPELGDRRFEVLTDLANVYAEKGDLFERDMRSLESRLSNDPNADARTTQAQIQTQLQRRNENYRQAIPLYREVLALNPNNPYALAGLAKVHLQLGNDDLGIEFAQRYLALSQESRLRWQREMQDWEQTQGPGNVTDDQRKFFQGRIYGAREKEKRMHLMLGSVHMRREEFGPAVESFNQVLAIDSAVPAAYAERAQAYAALRQYRLAIGDLEEYLKITDPEMHRKERVNAAELLSLYQRIVDRQAGRMREAATQG